MLTDAIIIWTRVTVKSARVHTHTHTSLSQHVMKADMHTCFKKQDWKPWLQSGGSMLHQSFQGNSAEKFLLSFLFLTSPWEQFSYRNISRGIRPGVTHGLDRRSFTLANPCSTFSTRSNTSARLSLYRWAETKREERREFTSLVYFFLWRLHVPRKTKNGEAIGLTVTSLLRCGAAALRAWLIATPQPLYVERKWR